MSDPQAAASALLESLLVAHADARTPETVRDNHDGVAVLFGSSVLEIRVQASARVDSHARPEPLDEMAAFGRIDHQWTTTEQLRADLWRWCSSNHVDPEQTLDLVATFAWEGGTYRLDLASNSIDFGKGLGRELPATMTWDSLLGVVAEFIGAPAIDRWSAND